MLRSSFVVVLSLAALPAAAQEQKPVPKDSVRVVVPGCSKGYVFTADRRTEDTPGVGVPEGTHLRMSGPKNVLAEITAEEGTKVEITGLIRKGQMPGDGVALGGGVHVLGGRAPVAGGGSGIGPGYGGGADRLVIDVEGWRPVAGTCATR
jgi:hypothetical protein